MNEIVVISPHLDDAAFSIGAFIHRQVQLGGDVRVVTVLASNPAPESTEPSWWDAACGFESSGAAARIRREEDRSAARILGATPVWLPYGDMSYGRGAPDDVIWADVAAAIGSADAVLLPGYPLRHPDHVWVTKLVLQHRHEFRGKIGFYGEQPYFVGALIRQLSAGNAPTERAGRPTVGQFLRCLLYRPSPPGSTLRERGVLEQQVTWKSARASAPDRHAKRRAITSYRSQLRPVGLVPIVGALIYENAVRGEALAWEAEHQEERGHWPGQREGDT